MIFFCCSNRLSRGILTVPKEQHVASYSTLPKSDEEEQQGDDLHRGSCSILPSLKTGFIIHPEWVSSTEEKT